MLHQQNPMRKPPTKKAKFSYICSEDVKVLNSGHSVYLGQRVYNCEGFLFPETVCEELNMEMID